MNPSSARAASRGHRLFAASFCALFLELLIIRWAPSTLRLVAYYANLMLISSFLGLGLGALSAAKRRGIFGLFPFLLLAEVALLLVCRRVLLPGSEDELRFFSGGKVFFGYGAMVALFFVNAAVFAPLGQKLGGLFEELPPLEAYAWDLSGSVCGALCFGVFSVLRFSPPIGMAIAGAVYLPLAEKRARWIGAAAFAAILVLMRVGAGPDALWSPYYYVTVHDGGGPVAFGSRLGRDAAIESAVVPPRSVLRTMPNPPIYGVRVNQDNYQADMSIDVRRYPNPTLAKAVADVMDGYRIPYVLAPAHGRVLVLGAGGGTDVQAALLSGAREVDAVDVDPVLVALSRRINPSGVYDDPRVDVHVDDARAFLRRAKPGYDMVVFGWLDSQGLFSQLSSIRLDGYVYTVESMRTAYALLGDDGLLAVSFVAGREWLADKLVRMLRDATGRLPVIYESQGQVVLCVPRGRIAPPPARLGRFRFVRPEMPLDAVEPPTDDWPYLYLSRRTIPPDYLGVIGLLAAASIAIILALRGGGIGRDDGRFFFLGFGFLLLETARITDCSLYFGATWLVTTAVVVGVLLMALAANAAARALRFSPRLYLPLFAALALLALVPKEAVLSLPLSGRILWTALAVPLPVFFAGLIFSTTFRDAARPSAAFGANLVGAVAGGFSEYLGMAIGHRRLDILIFAAYAASLLCRPRLKNDSLR